MVQNALNFGELRDKYPVFCYESYYYSLNNVTLDVNFRFSIGDEIVFKPSLQIPVKDFFKSHILSKEQLDLLIFHIGMIELISYWKCTCSPVVLIKPAHLTAEQLSFFKKIYFNGLGEFFYLNGIETTLQSFMDIKTAVSPCLLPQSYSLKDEYIIPIGGGKDSVVTLECIKKGNYPITPMIINPRGATIGCIEKAGYTMEDVIEVKRHIDPFLLELNGKGFLNGHTPFSALLAFVSILCSALTQKKHIALSNESSANESTVSGSDVNHQYSKSFQFENDFRQYVSRFISSEFNYFSFLRPLSELQIAALFSSHPKYFSVFRSCNAGSKTDSWCGSCSKCLFAYLILSPFIEPETMISIFGKNMLDDHNMHLFFDQLQGKSETKPFECVGTIEEVNAALILTKARFFKEVNKSPFLLEKICITDENVQKSKALLHIFEKEHFLSNALYQLLTQSTYISFL